MKGLFIKQFRFGGDRNPAAVKELPARVGECP